METARSVGLEPTNWIRAPASANASVAAEGFKLSTMELGMILSRTEVCATSSMTSEPQLGCRDSTVASDLNHSASALDTLH
jgi:hypothetical protein